MNRSYADFPRNEPGLVDNFLGTAYDVVKRVADNLPAFQNLDKILAEIDDLAEATIEAYMIPVRAEMQALLAQAQAAAAEASKINTFYPFVFDGVTLTYDIREISGSPDTTTAGMALWVEGAIEYSFSVTSATSFTINNPENFATGASMGVLSSARFINFVAP